MGARAPKTKRVKARAGETPGGDISKGERTRRHLARTAFELFEQRGFERTTLREIAAQAGVSLGLLYRYYSSKDALVIELYDELSHRFVERARTLPAGGWMVRTLRLLRISLEVLAPHREALRAMLPSLTVPPGHPLFIPGDQPSQLRVQERFEEAVAGSSDPPLEARRFGRQLYLVHLGVVLAWLLERSPEQSATQRGFELAERVAPLFSALTATGAVASLMSPVGELVELAVLGKSEEKS
jgi:AcrR family transcriptional regulator